MNKSPKLFIPGPTHVSDEILEAFSTPQIGHRTPEISELISELVLGVQDVLYTKNHIYLVSHPATGLWEMGVRNGVKRKILHCVNGAFSNKWVQVTKQVGLEYGVIEYEWGKPILSLDIRKKLESGKYDAVALVHNETSTGVMSNLSEIGLMMADFPDVLLLVDAVSSMSGIKISVDNDNIDFIFASTQKAWGLPAGFSIASVSDKFITKSKTIKNRGYILNTDIYEKYYNKNQTPYTPSIPHMFGLKKALELIFKEGLENRWNRHKDMANIVREWALEMGQSLYAAEGAQSFTVTSINNDRNWDINKINDDLLYRGFRMDRGYGNLKGDVFRIAHMGNIFKKDLLEYLQAFKEVVDE